MKIIEVPHLRDPSLDFLQNMRGGEQSPALDFLFLFYQEKRKK
jgi:hypothetical protein